MPKYNWRMFGLSVGDDESFHCNNKNGLRRSTIANKLLSKSIKKLRCQISFNIGLCTFRQQLLTQLMYLIADLKFVSDSSADKSDRDGNVEAEAILSRILAQIEEQFEVDEADDYLHLVQFLDPKVSYRVISLDEINRLLDRVKTFLPQLEIAAEPIQPELMKMIFEQHQL